MNRAPARELPEHGRHRDPVLHARVHGERASVLILMPVAVLIVVLLAAIAVDLSAVQLARHDLLDAAGAAANDAVGTGLDEDALRRGEGYRVDAARATEGALRSLDARGLGPRLTAPPEVVVRPDGTVVVTLEARADYVFAKALPGTGGHTTVRARSSASPLTR